MIGARPALIGDAAEIAAIEVETWRATYPGVLADEVLLRMSVDAHVRLWTHEMHRSGAVWVWQGEDGIAGFGSCGRQREAALPYDAEVYTLYVLPDAQGTGIGRELLWALFAQMIDDGARSAMLWVVRANPARFFYERLGGRLVLQKDVAVGGRPVPCLGYAWDDLAAALRHAPARRRPES